MDIFSYIIGTSVIHKATQTPVIVKSISWFKNQMDFDVLVPQMAQNIVEANYKAIFEYLIAA